MRGEHELGSHQLRQPVGLPDEASPSGREV